MAAVIVENFFLVPADLTEVVDMDRAAQWCLDTYRAHGVCLGISSDRMRSLCVYEAPDAEAMRRVAEVLRPPIAPVIWPATLHLHPSDPVQNFDFHDGETALAMVDRKLEEPSSFEALQAMEDAKSSCLVMHRVRFLRSYLSLDGLRMVCIYAAPDLEAVRSASRMTGLPFVDILAATAHSRRPARGLKTS